jgi:hypothetical protein
MLPLLNVTLKLENQRVAGYEVPLTRDDLGDYRTRSDAKKR